MFFGSYARHGLEPMGKMSSTSFDSPLLHGISHYVGYFSAKFLTILNGLF